jgi:predicted nucleic acid-binding Zn ribbon protein
MSEAKSSMPCPNCGKVAERRISAGGGLLFKGSGFYITDYGKDGKKGDKKPPESKNDAKSETKSESKPAESKAESKPAPAAPPTSDS